MALLLGFISAIGPFANHMYLPALPDIAEGLDVAPSQVQWSLTSFFASFALAQLLYGSAADRWGRRLPLLVGLGFFVVGTVGCALAGDIGMLVAFRFIQGAGAAATAAVPRAIVRDLHTGHDAARMTALLMLVFSVSSILAPLAGSGLTAFAGWRAVFWGVLVAALGGLLVTTWLLPETLPATARDRSSLGGAAKAYFRLLQQPRFLALSGIGGLGAATFYAYLAQSSLVLIGQYGLTQTQYSLAFGTNAIVFIGASQAAGRLGRRFGLEPLVRWAAAGCALAMSLLLVARLVGEDSLALMMGLLYLGYGCLGLVVPVTAVLAMDDQGNAAGTAAALMGAMQLAVSAVVIALASPFAGGGALPMIAAIAASAVGAWVLAECTLRRSTANSGQLNH
ncbi:multidrug effflux MFS transporter [Burkholderia multivorans]|uniref:multidrug effflux MFS transporter n=1 Tax=Burkholderia multivorans TaxID=87883 RepID=UPI0021BEB8AF|nr:multidrug effflux MFS transporter [Burkholderia multivorans]